MDKNVIHESMCATKNKQQVNSDTAGCKEKRTHARNEGGKTPLQAKKYLQCTVRGRGERRRKRARSVMHTMGRHSSLRCDMTSNCSSAGAISIRSST